ncbi:MAG TPA: DUF3307 domain-containing protein [Puia sp.]|jgi:hypothetical protein|nr:DUF3307 domain-containing protein [Puia sp.]
MIPGIIWLIKLILSHLLTDFILQPAGWVKDRREKHFTSAKLYLHVMLTAGLAYLFMGWRYWGVALVILITHFVIDVWKSYRPRAIRYFVIDQLLHLGVIVSCWLITFRYWGIWDDLRRRMDSDSRMWIGLAAFVFVTTPAGILIGELTRRWSGKINDPDNTLVNAGKWIGIAERIIVLLLVLHGQFSAIGLLVAAKGIIRFSEKDRQEIKTEYLVIGTLLSIGIAIVTGVAMQILLRHSA